MLTLSARLAFVVSLTFVASLSLIAPAAIAQDTILDAVDRGWYNLEKGHPSSSRNTLTGICCGTANHNSFFVFDLGSIVQPVGAATLRLELERYHSSDAQEPFAVFDVTSDIELLRMPQSGPFVEPFYQDLQSGALYATGVATSSARGMVLEIPLNAAAVANINGALGGFFAVGVHLTDQRVTSLEYIRFSERFEPRTHQLVLEPGAFFEVGLQPASALSPTGGMHTVTVSLVDRFGAPVNEASVRVDVVSGPNAGVGGAVTTNQAGVAQFTYTGDGGEGLDFLVASFDDGEENVFVSIPVRKFWDEDCNGNGLPDTCDVDCGGFGDLCGTEIASCGESSDGDDNGVPDECNLPPRCKDAVPSQEILWPPSHRLTPVSVGGVTDPDGDSVTIVITAVHQDEEVDERGSGNTCPDATGIGSSVANLAAERSGNSDGRVYHVEFQAADGKGGICTAIVPVCVPQSKNSGCGDQGLLYDASICSNFEGAAPQ